MQYIIIYVFEWTALTSQHHTKWYSTYSSPELVHLSQRWCRSEVLYTQMRSISLPCHPLFMHIPTVHINMLLHNILCARRICICFFFRDRFACIATSFLVQENMHCSHSHRTTRTRWLRINNEENAHTQNYNVSWQYVSAMKSFAFMEYTLANALLACQTAGAAVTMRLPVGDFPRKLAPKNAWNVVRKAVSEPNNMPCYATLQMFRLCPQTSPFHCHHCLQIAVLKY